MSLDFAVNGSDGSQGVFTFRIGLSRAAESREELRQRYNELERASRELAGRLRASLADPASREGLRKRLRETVEQAFIARQSLQRAELAEFAKRLQGIQQSIETRETFRQQIVDRRVEELLGEQLKWDSDTAIPAPAQSTATSPPASPYSAPLGGPFVPGGVVPLRPGTNFRVEKMTDDNLFWTALGARLAVARQEEIGTDRYRGGLRITAVRAGGPAEKAGLHVGDILVGVGNWETLSLEHLNFIFQETAARTAVQLHAIRQGPYGATRVSEMFQWELPNSAP